MSEAATKRQKPLQKLASFTEQDFDIMKNELEEGWRVVSLIANGTRYVGVIEEVEKCANDASVFIPPRKKIKIVM